MGESKKKKEGEVKKNRLSRRFELGRNSMSFSGPANSCAAPSAFVARGKRACAAAEDSVDRERSIFPAAEQGGQGNP
jgi:hypothetical protein